MRKLDEAILALCAVGILFAFYVIPSWREERPVVPRRTDSVQTPFEELASRYSFIGEGTMRRIYCEYASLDPSELEDELELVHQYYHQLREEITASPNLPGAVVLNTWSVGNATGRSPDLDHPEIRRLVEDLWPVCLDRSVSGRVLTTRLIPLPYSEYQGFWDAKLRMDLLQLQLGTRSR